MFLCNTRCEGVDGEGGGVGRARGICCEKKWGSKGGGKEVVLLSKTVQEWFFIVFVVFFASRTISLHCHMLFGPREFQEASPALYS